MKTIDRLSTIVRCLLARLLRPADLTPEEAEAIGRGFRVVTRQSGADAA